MKTNIKKLLLLLFLPAFLLCASHSTLRNNKCDQYSEYSFVPDSMHLITNDFEGVIFPKDFEYLKKENVHPTWTPNWKDIFLAETLMTEYAKNNLNCFYKDRIKYKRQYIGIEDSIIEVYLTHEEMVVQTCNLRRFIIHIDDGGCSVVHAKIDIRKRKCLELIKNGEA